MTAVLTGDIINSRELKSEEWILPLKKVLEECTLSDTDWEIYRGDSFQLKTNSKDALKTALLIKSIIKTKDIIDVRISIGIGSENFHSNSITESNGEAYINSGKAFDQIKNKTLVINTPFNEFNDYFSSILNLVGFITENWKPATALTIYTALKYQNLKQKEIAEIMQKDKTTINKALKRGAYNYIKDVLDLYHIKIKLCMH